MLQTAKYRGCFIYFDGFYSHLKISENWSPDFICSRAWAWKRSRANNFPPFLTLEIPVYESPKRDSWRLVETRIFFDEK